jgi:hypothetical protein
MTIAQEDYSYLASLHGEELDDMILRKDYVCAACGLTKDWHVKGCAIGKLLETRARMVPVVIVN